MKLEGRIWKFGDHIDTDVIIPARFLNISDKDELAKSCFIDTRPDFAKNVRPGDIVVAGINFGCGSSREHAPLAIKAAGVGVVIAKGFARIFYRNAFNIGLPILESEDVTDSFNDGDRISVDLQTGEIKAVGSSRQFSAKPIPPFMQEIIHAGGLVNYTKQKKGK
jgi:3-isopropylmalate/(R)-2-methylmalate dehydratase small subunit